MSNEGQTPDLTGDRGFRTVRESTYRYALAGCAVLSVLTTVSIIAVLVLDAADFFSVVPIAEFLTATEFSASEPTTFGVLPLALGTMLITIGAAVIALPVGLLTAIYLSEYATERTRSVLKPMLEVLAGVPTVVYGYFAIVYITPALNVVIGWLNGALGLGFPNLGLFNGLSASLVVGIMIIPMVSSISEDAMSSVPDSLRQAGYGLGATKFNVSLRIVVPAAISGIASSFILAISRAIGETMAVVLAAGSQPPDIPAVQSAFGIPYVAPGDLIGLYTESSATMTVAMINIASGDISGGSTAYKSLFAIGLTLFVITLAMNVVSDVVASRYREEYE
ncbi:MULTISPECIES: phosphate ABC transporter permease subunit PstC [Haloarcula]|uniref:Phosphate transport system permease protein n=1 Tax=Haloarcula pellucida TaxID=1427151 RepID=A0A830GPK7_9EURY|nr:MULTISPECIES: phosphate ABC transporter permease subunit PstC [Halomicroarcula]MBX0348142.1 phosphate ABC transporter permease subunit PstC [Halomicroarcula pellucida]MDS0277986.1 phosphate ABC transporter permease subunit PstC [Halomicroarcula sp. S1AR25-4]GGN97163.1 phosphate ABC transporter permease subunit PstC [Halomicroarcula pellucida]